MEMLKKILRWAMAQVDRIFRRRPPEHADERTMRRMAEQKAGGTSSAESAARHAQGAQPAGTHGGKAVPREGPEHERPEFLEPQAREARTPRGDHHIPERRRGA